MKIALYIISFILLLLPILPRTNSKHWSFMVWEYLHFQIVGLIILAIFFWLLLNNNWLIYDKILIGLLIGMCFYLGRKAFPYLPIAPKEVLSTKSIKSGKKISMLLSNVLQKNTEYNKLIDLVNKWNPDIFLANETDEKWEKALSVLHKDFPYRISQPQENTYGMILMSRFPLSEEEIHHFSEKDVPSIETNIEIGKGIFVKFYGLHPKPPAPNENETSEKKDKELITVAKLIEALPKKQSAIVAGDLNDVAWSQTSMLFQRVSGMLDIRKGRGFYNTFNADVPFMRFPLDHIYCSNHFMVRKIKKLPHIGSDHFPMYAELVYNNGFTEIQEPQAEKDGDQEKVKEVLK